MRVYIINGHVTRRNLDYKSHRNYCMGYEATTGVIIYWKPDQPFYIHRAHNIWFGEYNYHIYIEEKHTTGSFLLQQYPKSLIDNSYLLNFFPCELDLTYTPFHDKRIITYKSELPPVRKEIGFNLFDDEDFTIPYVTDAIPNSPDVHKIPTQAKENVWIKNINREETIKAQGVLDEINRHQTPFGKSKVNISL